MRLVLAMIAALGLAACGSVGSHTPYRAKYDAFIGYGSKITELADGRYEIYNNAGPMSPSSLPLEHNMLRAAQLAQEKGAAFFEVGEAAMGDPAKPVPVGMPAVHGHDSAIRVRLLTAFAGAAANPANVLAPVTQDRGGRTYIGFTPTVTGETYNAADVIALYGPRFLKAK